MATVARSLRPILCQQTTLRLQARQIPRLVIAARCRGEIVGRSYSSTSVVRAVVQDGPALTQTNRAEVTLRRFWKTVHIKQDDSGSFQVTLDHRALKTPGGAKLLIPSERRLLALLIANEWENQDEVLKQHTLPVTSLASRAIDILGEGVIRAGVIDQMMKYLDTDTILFTNDTPTSLVRMQKEHWEPLYSWLKETYGVKLNPAEGFSPPQQSEDARSKLRRVLEGMDGWELAAFERAAYASKSFVIALALCKGRLTANQAAEASHVEVRSQIEQWGEVEDTHDVDYQDIRRALGSVACLLVKA
ncbi:ATP synthase mitochondrial F1 complex assembly factor 2 [Kwoniella mangroviensis CBS 10435]|uniref:ATP synthase mitochondrial F1 complex assembly factor 2 n=1 Tax=Kwoniella mangroviensis CBS 10435 TaxID=1331196 RepID=A0A1B9IL10_9TREE|nr:ATP synthase mitochondrial F1 complex assembly factor 2 [Kwoniella mangroviensis CBS 10435]